MSFLRRTDASTGAVGVPGGDGGVSCSILGSCPALRDYLSLEKYDDGTPRERATLLVFIEQGQLKVCLSDRAASASFWRSGYDLLGIIESMEQALQAGRAEWRVTTAKPHRRR